MNQSKANVASPSSSSVDSGYSESPPAAELRERRGKRFSTATGYNDERLSTEEDSVDAAQFDEPPQKFPLKSVLLILGFLIMGSVCLTFGILTSSGYFDNNYEDRSWPLLILGILLFIPGGYYGYIIINVLCRRQGFTFDDIPIF